MTLPTTTDLRAEFMFVMADERCCPTSECDPWRKLALLGWVPPRDILTNEPALRTLTLNKRRIVIRWLTCFKICFFHRPPSVCSNLAQSYDEGSVTKVALAVRLLRTYKVFSRLVYSEGMVCSFDMFSEKFIRKAKYCPQTPRRECQLIGQA